MDWPSGDAGGSDRTRSRSPEMSETKSAKIRTLYTARSIGEGRVGHGLLVHKPKARAHAGLDFGLTRACIFQARPSPN
jgi:hypothetical protein